VEALEASNKQLVEEKQLQERKYGKLEKEMRENPLKKVCKIMHILRRLFRFSGKLEWHAISAKIKEMSRENSVSL
jgi:imidazoleglycerol phosphate dehydratase HisB